MMASDVTSQSPVRDLGQPMAQPSATAKPAVASWRFLSIDWPTAAEQMSFDEELAARGEPVLRLFRWRTPALSYGYRQTLPAWADPQTLAQHGVECVERPTGGGIAVHGSDLSCAIVVPQASVPELDGLMELVCRSFADSVRGFGVPARWLLEASTGSRVDWCLTGESPYAIMVGQQKLCGFAIRRFERQWLVQGSLLVRAIPEAILHVMPEAVARTFHERAIALQRAAIRKIFDEELTAAIARAWRTVWGVPCEWVDAQWPRAQAAQWLESHGPVSTKWWHKTFSPTRPIGWEEQAPDHRCQGNV